MDINQLKNNRNLQIIVTVIIILIITIIIYSLYRWITRTPKVYLVSNIRNGNYIQTTDQYTGKITKTNPYQQIPNARLPLSKHGNGYTYSLWLNVNDWDYNYGKPKHILSKGDRGGVSVNPGIWLYPKDNNLMIRIDTFNRTNNKSTTESGLTCQNWNSQYPNSHIYTPENYPNDDLKSNYCRNPDNKSSGDWCYTKSKDVKWESCGINSKNPPSMSPYQNDPEIIDTQNKCDLIKLELQRWNNIVIVLNNKTLDVYLNGKLARSCEYDGPPLFNDQPVHITDRGGFGGQLGEVVYYNRALNPSDVYNIYSYGKNTFQIFNKIQNLKPQVFISAGVNQNNISIGSPTPMN